MRVRNNSATTKIAISIWDTFAGENLRFSFPTGATRTFPNKWYNEIEEEVDLYEELEILLDAEGGVVDQIGITMYFDIPDWVLAGEFYYVDLEHTLEGERLQMEIFRDATPKDRKVWVHREEIRDPDTIRLYVTSDPDARFKGKATIIKVNP